MHLNKIKNLHRSGASFIGDCPVCGYENSFTLTYKNNLALVHCHAKCDQKELWRSLQQELATDQRHPLPLPKTPKKDTTAYIERLWKESVSAEGTLVESYVRFRGICSAIPASLRFLQDCKYTPTGQFLPAMVAAVTDYAGNLKAVHRTFLASDGKGKAEVITPKMSLGPIRGLAVHLAQATDELIITEGIETGLSVMKAMNKPVWAALSAGGMENLILPPLPLAAEIIIAADSDPVGMRAASIAARRFREEGRKVKITAPPAGKDFNDLLREAR